jgi:hypothetical protein
MMSSKKWTKPRIGIEVGVAYLLLTVIMDWRKLAGQHLGQLVMNVGGMLIEAALFGLLFALLFPRLFRQASKCFTKRSQSESPS